MLYPYLRASFFKFTARGTRTGYPVLVCTMYVLRTVPWGLPGTGYLVRARLGPRSGQRRGRYSHHECIN